MLTKFDNSGKTAVVTGAVGLLGVQHCYALLEINTNIVVTDIDQPKVDSFVKELKADFPNGNILGLTMDITQRADIENVKNKTLETYGSIDILINNAAIDPKVKSKPGIAESSRFEMFDLDSWDFQIRVGLTGAMQCSQVFGKEMADKNKGVILNISSDLSVIAPDQRIYRKDGAPEEEQPVKPVTYSVIKAGLVGLTKYLSSYWADKNIRVNAISPGGVFNGQHDDFVAKLTNLIPMGRMAEKDEYRSTIQYLCSDASSYMTGQNIVVDGGRSVL